ncbi:MAG: RHS repeat-associated core domain-containing protein [Pseudomonadota bacterium]
MYNFRFLKFGILFVLLAVFSIGPATALVFSRAKPVTIDAADKILRARIRTAPHTGNVGPALPRRANAAAVVAGTVLSSTAIGCASGSSQPVEISALASSLKCDLDLIYEYVYNNIEYEPLFGSNKGALGTLLDQRGNDIDQAQLFVALLNAAGITQTSFQYGYITVTGPTAEKCPETGTILPVASAPGWLGVKNDGTAIANMLDNGGIPTGSTVWVNNDGTIACLDVAHVWVQVTINGTNYVFDPSFKQHLVSAGLANLSTILGYSQAQFVSDAGGTTDAVSISNINRAKVRSDLASYANNLISYIRANNPTATLNDIIGGKTIVPLAGSPIRQTSLPYLAANQPSGFPQNWGASVPDAYRTCLAISMPGVTAQEPCASATSQTVVFYSDQTYGQRITVFSVPDPNISGNYIPTLRINGAAPTSGTNIGPSTSSGQSWGIYADITHPYAWTGDNQAQSLTVKAGGSYLISAGWGRVGRGMVAKHQQLLSQALAAPGVDPASESVLGESLAIISYNWLAENATQMAISDAIGEVTTQYHHGVGITAQTSIQNTGSQGPYVDLPMNVVSSGQETCYPTSPCPFPGPIISSFYSNTGISSSLESAVLEQTQAPTPNMMAASTIRLVDQNASTGAKTFFADGTTSAGQSNYINTIRPLLQQSGTAYSSADLAAIDDAVTGSSPPPANPSPTGRSQVLAPINGAMSVGLWKGAGYTIINSSSNSITMTQKISGGLSGGFSGTDIDTEEQVDNTDETLDPPAEDPDVPDFVDAQPPPDPTTIEEPIDLVTGTEIYNNKDLEVGGGTFPYALSFSRTYLSSSSLTDVGLGNGWTHDYSLSAKVDSDPYAGMGENSPISAASAIAAIYVSQDLLNNSPQTASSMTLAWIVDNWFTDQLTNNAAVISRPSATEEYIALPHTDGATAISYNSPFRSSALLTAAGTGTGNPTSFSYRNKDGSEMAFATAPGDDLTLPISSWTSPNGMQANFTYNSAGALTSVANNIGRQLNLSYSGTHISSVSDGSRSVNFTYSGDNLTGMTDPLGDTTTYAYDTTGVYDTAGHLTQIFYPTRPNTPFVTNWYDPLGRVVQQANANGAASLFYFAGSRTETVDPLGNRDITYQTPDGKILSDAKVLSPSFGDVFGDTEQQDGLVNVTTNQYDGLDRLVLTTLPEGGSTDYTYVESSNPWANNIASTTRTAKPDSPLAPLTTAFTYDAIYNKPTSVTDPLGLVTTMGYDPATGNLLNIVSDFGGAGHFNATRSFTYNSIGQVLTATDPLGIVTSSSYDGYGNSIAVTHDCCGAGHLNQTSKTAYNAFGDPVSVTDPNGNVTIQGYDANRRRIETISPATPDTRGGLVTTFAYDPVGQLLQTQQSANCNILHTVKTSYTPTGKIATTTDANGNVTVNAYDADDRLSSVTDPLGRVTSYGYDALGRQISVSNLAIQSAPLSQETYTPDGVVGSLTNANGKTTTYTPDGFDRLSTTTFPDNSTQILNYDADGNVLSRQTRAGSTIGFGYDTLNRLVIKAAPSEPTVSYAYDLASHLIGMSDNSPAIAVPTADFVSTTSYSYDQLNRLIATSFSPVQAQAPPSTASSATFNYGYDATNRRISQTTNDSSYWSYPTASTNVSYSANNLDQYTAVASVTPTYDPNGNLTYDGTFTYSYDPEGRLISASGAGNTAAYAYDARGWRKEKSVNGATTVLVQDPQQRAVLDYSGTDGTIQDWYAFGLGPNEAFNQNNLAGSTRSTFIPDTQGSIVASLNASSGALTKAGFLPYGESSTTAGSFRYTGARIDAETNGLYDFRARIYSPMLGRFMQTDPSGTQGGVNLYAYVGNDPLNQVDVSGLAPDEPTSEESNSEESGFVPTTLSTDTSQSDVNAEAPEAAESGGGGIGSIVGIDAEAGDSGDGGGGGNGIGGAGSLGGGGGGSSSGIIITVDSSGQATVNIQGVDLTEHAALQATVRNISLEDISEALQSGNSFSYNQNGDARTGYYDPLSTTFVGVGNGITTVINLSNPSNYLFNLTNR